MGNARNLGSLLNTSTTIQADDLNIGQLGNRNKIINGNFEVWQRGTSFSGINSPRYTSDRWMVYGASSTTVDVTRQSFTAGQTDVEGNPRYFMRIDNTPDPDTTWMETWQRIEDVTYFSGVTVTLSFWIRSNRYISNQNYFGFFQNFGSGGSTSVGTNSSNFDITTSWQKKTLTVTLPSISGKTIGTGSYLQVHLLQPSPIQADTYYDIAQVQLEAGDTATPFEHRSYGQELALCQRYYQVVYQRGNSTTCTYYSFYNRFYGNQIQFSPMRATPSVNHQKVSGAFYWVNPGVAAFSADSENQFSYEANYGNNQWGTIEYSQIRQAGGGTPTDYASYRLEASIRFRLDAEL